MADRRADRGLTLCEVEIRHNDGPALLQISTHIAPGEALTLMGPSGIGKSTLLAAITGTLAPSFELRGAIWLDGKNLAGLPPEKRRVGILFQDHLLFPHLSVGENLAFGLAPGPEPENRRARIQDALAQIDLGDMFDRDPATLSGGQRARVALMRMLLSEPRALLLDEPFSRLDIALREKMRGLVFSRAREMGLPVLLVTHDPSDAEAAGGETVHLAPQNTRHTI